MYQEGNERMEETMVNVQHNSMYHIMASKQLWKHPSFISA
jgi:hypothetical protein